MEPLIRDLARVERPRERLAQVGVEGLRNNELLALVLRTGLRGCGALALAEDILRATPLESLLSASLSTLLSIRGLGISRAAALLAAAELARRAHDRKGSATPRLLTVSDIAAQCIDLREKKKEHLVAFFLNARHQLIVRETISIGTLTASLAHPREIFAPAIGKAAAAVILAHNHPSGDPSPSDEDAKLTQRIVQAGRILGIELMDHLIIAESGCYSFKTSGGLL